jgi:predicted lipoprotein with Yx(FWY)xxD motif
VITYSARLSGAARVAGAVAAAALLATACSSSAKPSHAGSGGSAGGGVTVETHSGAMGTYLTDASGKTLYLFAADSNSKSNCSGGCASFWPPLTATGAPSAAGGAKASMLATITRSDGSKQVTYGGHPLYYFKQDTKVGQTSGEGFNNFGAKWWLVSPSGQSITTASGGSSPAPSTSSGGGGWA